MGKRIAGDVSRKRRLCFAQHPAKAGYYATYRSYRFARRCFGETIADHLPATSAGSSENEKPKPDRK